MKTAEILRLEGDAERAAADLVTAVRRLHGAVMADPWVPRVDRSAMRESLEAATGAHAAALERYRRVASDLGLARARNAMKTPNSGL